MKNAEASICLNLNNIPNENGQYLQIDIHCHAFYMIVQMIESACRWRIRL